MCAGAGEATRAKVSYELAGRLLGADEAAKAQLAEDIAGLDYSAQPKQTSQKPGECTYMPLHHQPVINGVQSSILGVLPNFIRN